MRRAVKKARKRKLASSTGLERRRRFLDRPIAISVAFMRRRAEAESRKHLFYEVYLAEINRPIAVGVSIAGSYLSDGRIF